MDILQGLLKTNVKLLIFKAVRTNLSCFKRSVWPSVTQQALILTKDALSASPPAENRAGLARWSPASLSLGILWKILKISCPGSAPD